MAQALTVMVNPLYTGSELTYQLNDSGAKTLQVLVLHRDIVTKGHGVR